MRSESHSHWLSSHVTLSGISSILLVLCTSYIYFSFFGNNANKIHKIGGFSIVNAWSFFNKRYDFLRSNFDKSGHNLFSFKILRAIVAMSGDDARKMFFHEKGLSFAQGYRLLMGGTPRWKDISEDELIVAAVFNKYLLKIFVTPIVREETLIVVPTLFSDINKRMDAWGVEGKINPFKSIYDLVFQMTVHMASCHELAADLGSIQKMKDLYWTLEKSATPASLLFPWFPSTARRNSQQATKDLYNMVSHHVDIRRKAAALNLDAIDLLIADGADNPTIFRFVLGVIFAGVINTGIISCWILLYLGSDSVWKDKAIVEIRNLITTYTDTASSQPISRRLSTIPMSAWEDEMPVTESIIRETLRIVNNGTLLRRNLSDNVHVGDKAIDKGAFVAYNIGDVHLNEVFYPEPLTFDPSRFDANRQEGKQENPPFLGWGTGRHPCPGMKVAKLEIKIIVALVLSRYEYKLVDASGDPSKELPKPNRNDIHQVHPTL
ncbi:hypothetical protein PILCRDRAFT_62967 [Piloderma croceum F 1598]|uniref:Cytochrome P450 n=1 Tax=Piloderma croceum (strain F 1598) TaxID=765440 RepID=A0A0C3CDE5_PILCF|nr:hypothetical protein PILCRDRAFT_62967 [Piloderma croceum F 1598]